MTQFYIEKFKKSKTDYDVIVYKENEATPEYESHIIVEDIIFGLASEKLADRYYRDFQKHYNAKDKSEFYNEKTI